MSFHLVGLCPEGTGQHSRQNPVETAPLLAGGMWEQSLGRCGWYRNVQGEFGREDRHREEVPNSGYICRRFGLTLNLVTKLKPEATDH